MLQCTIEAADTLRSVRFANGVPDGFGTRIFVDRVDDGAHALRTTFCPEPAEGDTVVEDKGERFFVAGELRDAVDGMVLDIDDGPSTGGQADRTLVLRRVTGRTGGAGYGLA